MVLEMVDSLNCHKAQINNYRLVKLKVKVPHFRHILVFRRAEFSKNLHVHYVLYSLPVTQCFICKVTIAASM